MDVNEGLDGDHHIIFYILCDIFDSLGFEYYNTVFIRCAIITLLLYLRYFMKKKIELLLTFFISITVGIF